MIVKNVIIANMEMKISVNIMPIVISSIIQKDCQDTVDLVNLSLQKQMICLYMPKIHHLKKVAFTEPVACVINSINRTDIKFGDDVVVIGGGTMGLLHVMLLRQRGARVILSEPLAERREKALSLGCSNVIDPMAGDAVEAVKALTGGRGANFVFNTTAIPVIAGQAVEMTAPTGTTIMFSSIHPNEKVPVDMGAIHSYQKTITGAVSPTFFHFMRRFR